MAKKSQQSPLAFLNGATSISSEELRGQGWLLRELAAQFDITETAVSYIARGKKWKHVPLAGTKKPAQSVRIKERKVVA